MSTNGQQFCENALWRTARRRDFSYQWAEKMLVRYVENPPLAMAEEAVAYLLGADGAAKLTADGKVVTGTWRTVEAWLEESKPDRQGLRVLRLYHSCVPAANAVADTDYTAGNNCTFRVTHTPYFRLLTLPVPPAGTSGVTYEIAGERRDPETGLWMCTVVRREQFTTWTGIVTAADDIFKTVTEQTFLGVRTGDVLAFKAGAEAGTLWTAGNPEKGTLIENVSVSKNDNCTTNVTQRKTVAKTGTGGAGIALDRMKTIQGLETTVDENTVSRTTAEAEETTQTAGTAVTVKNNYRADGLIDVRKIVEEGEKYTDSYTVPDEDGDVTVTRYFNHTAAEEKALLAALSATRSNQASPGQVNKFRKFDGVIVSRPPRRGSNAHNRDAVDKTGLTYTRVELIHRDGVEYARTWTYTYNVKQDWGVDSGYAAYTGAKNGSNFSLLGDDWYKFEKVTDIKVSETPVTLTASPQSI